MPIDRSRFAEIEKLEEFGQEAESFVKMRDAEGVFIVRVRQSPLDILATGRDPISDGAYAAGRRLTADFDVGLTGVSNTAAICDTLATTVRPTAGELRDKLEGRLMRAAAEVRTPKDRMPRQIEAAQRIVAVQQRLGRTDWLLLEQLLRYERSPSTIAAVLGVSPHWAALQVRVSLCHLAAVYADLGARTEDF